MESDSNGRPSVGASDPPPVPQDLPREPVPPSSKGSGWPYAPQGWPNPDDKWGWKVGKRAAANSLYIDRYVSVPVSLRQGRRGVEFASRKGLEEYCKKKFPQMTDAANIFKAFDWKIPAPPSVEVYDAPKRPSSTAKAAAATAKDAPPPPSKAKGAAATAKEAQPAPSKAKGAAATVKEAPPSKGEATPAREGQPAPTGAAVEGSRVSNKRPASDNGEAVGGERRKKKSKKVKKRCRAGNSSCILVKGKKSGSGSVGRLVCHICFLEPDFCCECKCILCCELLQQPNASAAIVVRCGHMAVPGQGSCGHAAHLECALNAQLAGVVAKSGVDMEYRCRRCDSKTDLRATVIDMVGAMDHNAPQSIVESVLQLALQIVNDPRDRARAWAICIGDALEKIRAGVATFEVFNKLTLELNELGSGANGGVLGGDGALVQECSGVLDQVINWSRATNQVSTLVDLLHPSEAHLAPTHYDELVPAHSMPASSHDPPTICIQPRRDTTSQVDKYYEFCHELASRLKQSVSMPPRLLLEDHILECKAMVERVRGAACELGTRRSSTKVPIQERSKFESA